MDYPGMDQMDICTTDFMSPYDVSIEYIYNNNNCLFPFFLYSCSVFAFLKIIYSNKILGLCPA